MPQFKAGDHVTIVTVRGYAASWVFQDQRGIVLDVREGHRYLYEVALYGGGSLRFREDELTHAPVVPDKSPGRRVLEESAGFPLGTDTARDQRIMRWSMHDTSDCVPRSDPETQTKHSQQERFTSTKREPGAV